MILFAFVGGLVVFILGIIVRGLVLTALWDWFIVETFNVPSINVPIALGISLIVGMLTAKSSSSRAEASIGVTLTSSILTTLLIFAIGWVIHTFFM